MSNVCGGHGHVCCQDVLHDDDIRVPAYDPVCGKKLDCESKNVLQLKTDEGSHFFCSTKCMTKFVNNPDKYCDKPGFFAFLRRWF